MAIELVLFERIVRSAHRFTDREPIDETVLHPFDRRNIHPKLPPKTKKLFDDGYYAEATYNAFKYVDRLVSRHANLKESGVKLMMTAFNENTPLIKLTPLIEISEKDEQVGYRNIFAGSVSAIRNPRGHETNITDDIDTCLDHLSLASMLIRRLEQAGYH